MLNTYRLDFFRQNFHRDLPVDIGFLSQNDFSPVESSFFAPHRMKLMQRDCASCLF